jgi:hypothetical protein
LQPKTCSRRLAPDVVAGEELPVTRTLIVIALLAGSAVHAQTYKDVWIDVRQPWRSNAELDAAVQADAAACDYLVGEMRGIPSLRYRQCMASRDWQFGHLETLPRRFSQHAPASEDSTPLAKDFPSSPPPAPPDDVPSPG